MAAPVMGDNAEALADEEQHLRIPIVRRKRPTMTEHDGLTGAPILVENLDAGLGGERGRVRDPFVRGTFSACGESMLGPVDGANRRDGCAQGDCISAR